MTNMLLSVTLHQDQLVALASNGQHGRLLYSNGDLDWAIEQALRKRQTNRFLSSRVLVPARCYTNPPGRFAAIAEGDNNDLVEQDDHANKAAAAGEDTDDEHNAAMRKSHATMRKKPPTALKTYLFPRADQVKTSAGKKPLYPCCQCGSPEHWNWECPHFNAYQLKASCTGAYVEQDAQYVDAYIFYLNKMHRSSYDLPDRRVQVPSVANLQHLNLMHKQQEVCLKLDPIPESDEEESEESANLVDIHTMQIEVLNGDEGSSKPGPRPCRKAYIKDCKDLESELESHTQLKPKALTSLIELMDNKEGPVPSEGDHAARASTNVETDTNGIPVENSWEDMPLLDKDPHSAHATEAARVMDASVVKIVWGRMYVEGESAQGVLVLSTKGWLGSTDKDQIDLRINSCANVTLISEKFYHSMKRRPPLRKGLRMKLYQVTDKSASILGYVTIPVIMRSTTGEYVQLKAEAYVVSNLGVDILLREDFQLNHGLGVECKPNSPPEIFFLGYNVRVAVQAVGRSKEALLLQRTNHGMKGFVKAAAHQCKRTARQRVTAKDKKRKYTKVLASEDIVIVLESSRSIQVTGNLGDNDTKEWVVEQNLGSEDSDQWLAVATTLLTTGSPYLAVSNISKVPRNVKKGEVLRHRYDPKNHLDMLASNVDEATMQAHAERLSAFIHLAMDKDTHKARALTAETTGEATKPNTKNVRGEDQYGPKTAELPDNKHYDSSKLHKILDVGEVPDELKAQVWAMLKKHVRAFGFDNQLGQHNTKIHIRTKTDQNPISVPMYGSLPEKRKVIEEQVKKWLELKVIEPLRSPWSAPVVIAYCNGKARFCVNYQKLNAAAIPDKFPIPRQSDIMSVLLGSQVLSTLNALSGFLQLQVHPNDIEKTAFCTHQGLFNFLRMPFGLQNGPAIFQRVMQEILSPFLWIFCLVYIDDIVVYSKTFTKHVSHLGQVLEAVEKAGITLSPKKCHLFYSSILLLGHKVS
jgi:hypothetical protein